MRFSYGDVIIIVVFMEGVCSWWASFNDARAHNESPAYQVGSTAKQLSVLFLELFAEPVNSSNE